MLNVQAFLYALSATIVVDKENVDINPKRLSSAYNWALKTNPITTITRDHYMMSFLDITMDILEDNPKATLQDILEEILYSKGRLRRISRTYKRTNTISVSWI